MRLEAGLKASLGKPTYLNLNVPTNIPMFENISPLEQPGARLLRAEGATLPLRLEISALSKHFLVAARDPVPAPPPECADTDLAAEVDRLFGR
jgi:hypothetical protein